jgi:hypothetical protein
VQAVLVIGVGQPVEGAERLILALELVSLFAVGGDVDGSGANGRIWPTMMSAELPEGWA